MNKQKQMVLGLGIIVVLLAIVVIVIVQTSSSHVTSGTAATAVTQQSTTAGATGGMTASGAAVGADGEVPFDEATAVKVPAESTPQKWVEEYYQACDAGEWETAWRHLPAAKQQVTDVEALKTQLEGYGITGYKITNSQENGDSYEVSADQSTASYGTFTSVWVFVKGADGQWLLKTKAVAGMGQ